MGTKYRNDNRQDDLSTKNQSYNKQPINHELVIGGLR